MAAGRSGSNMPHQQYPFINKMVAVALFFSIVVMFWDYIALYSPPAPVRADREGANEVFLPILIKFLLGSHAGVIYS